MSEISNIRPWEHIHATTGEVEYHLDVHLVGGIEPDEWQFGTNRAMWLGVIAVMRHTRASSPYINTGQCNGCGQDIYIDKSSLCGHGHPC
jgi:hypothetical protein